MKIFKEGMSLRLDRREIVVADNGYSEPSCLLANDLKGSNQECHWRI